MAKCPRDGTQIDIDYGMATCPTCGVILFIDMDGEAMIGSQVPGAQAPKLESSDLEVPYNQTPFDEPVGSSGTSPGFQPPALGLDSGVDALAALNPIESESLDPEPPELAPVEALQTETPGEPIDSDMNMNQFLGYEPAPEVSGQDMMVQPEPIGGPGDPLGIADYANSEFSQAKDGPFLFRLIISGIDSKELRESLRESMEDSRFAWDTDELLKSISKGELHIRNVSPVKATILINRIKRLPVKIRWEQYPVTQAEP